MSKSFILTILVIVSALAIFLKYYSHNNSSTHTSDLVEGEKLTKVDQAPDLKTDIINNSRIVQNEQKEVPVQSTISQDDPNKLEQAATTISIQQVSEDMRGQEDENGVRHDINVWINEQNLNPDQKLALTQKARSIQKALIKAEEIRSLDIEAAREQAEMIAADEMKAVKCLNEKFNGAPEMYKYSDKIRELILNTGERIEADKTIDRALSGGIVIYPEGETCEK